MPEYGVNLYHNSYYLYIQDNKECVIVSDFRVGGNGVTKSQTNKEAFDEVSNRIKLIYKNNYIRRVGNSQCPEFSNICKAFMIVILRIEFPSLKCCDLYNHILTDGYHNFVFTGILKSLVDPPECYDHEMYISKIKTLLSDIDIDFINGTYSVNYKNLLSKYVPNVIRDMIISYSYS